jgi:hypothetical protein
MTVPPVTPPSGKPPRPYGGEPFPVSPHGEYYGQHGFEPQASKKMAGWALGLSILNCFSVGVLVAIGLAIAVLVKGQRDGRNHGKGMAIAALIISSLWILALVVFIVLIVIGKIEIDDSERNGSGEIDHEQVITVSLLRAGDCIGPGENQEMMREGRYEVTAVPCTDLHSAEVYHVFELADGDYPGDGEVVRLAETGCLDAFRGYVGVRPARSALGVTFLSPRSITWRISDDREVICFLSEVDQATIGSLEGAKR